MTTATPTLRELFDAHVVYVWDSLGRLGVPHADRDDAVQEVFLTVNDLLEDFDAARPFRPWVFSIAYRIALRNHRKRGRRREDLEAPEDLAAFARGSDDHDARDAREVVARALDAIDVHRRAVFVMKEIDDCEMTDIATLLGIPLNTAYSRLRLARDEFREAVSRLERAPDQRKAPR